MKKQAKKQIKNALCRMCKNDCKDMYKYGERFVQAGCYYLKDGESV